MRFSFGFRGFKVFFYGRVKLVRRHGLKRIRRRFSMFVALRVYVDREGTDGLHSDSSSDGGRER